MTKVAITMRGSGNEIRHYNQREAAILVRMGRGAYLTRDMAAATPAPGTVVDAVEPVKAEPGTPGGTPLPVVENPPAAPMVQPPVENPPVTPDVPEASPTPPAPTPVEKPMTAAEKRAAQRAAAAKE